MNANDTTGPDPVQYRKVARKNKARTVWRWVTILMGAIVAYNVLNAASLRADERRAELCADLSEFACDLAIGAAIAVNVGFAVGAGILGLVALSVWMTRDIYKEVVEPIHHSIIAPVQPGHQLPESPAIPTEPSAIEAGKLETLGHTATNGHIRLPNGHAYRLASPWARLAAFLIDLILLLIVDTLIIDPEASTLAQFAISWLTWIAYLTLCHFWWGQTLGKATVGAKVIAADTGEPATVGRAFLRAFTLCLLAPLVAAPMMFKESRRGWHDDSANTVVVKTR